MALNGKLVVQLKQHGGVWECPSLQLLALCFSAQGGKGRLTLKGAAVHPAPASGFAQ